MSETKLNIYQKLAKVQEELKAPKNLTNKFGNYKYRSAEGILEATKPLLAKYNLLLTISDEMIEVGDRIYVQAKAMLIDTESMEHQGMTVYASARESESKKGMDESQITGAASSYARKYALNGLFAIDDVKDADSDAPPKEVKPKGMTRAQYEAAMKAVEEATEKNLPKIKERMQKYPEDDRYRNIVLKGIANRESHLSKQPSDKA